MGLGIPDYPTIVKQPMDFKTATLKLQRNEYEGLDEVLSDLKLIFENAVKYNGQGHQISNYAQEFLEQLRR